MAKNLSSEKWMSVRWAMTTPRKARENGTSWRSDCFPLSFCADAGALLSGRNGGWENHCVISLMIFSLLADLLHTQMLYACIMVQLCRTYILLTVLICNLSSHSGLWGDVCIFFFILFSIMICHMILNIVPCVGRPPFLHTPSQSVADSQCCVRFRRTAKWLSSTNTCYLFSLKFFSHVGYCRVLSRVPCAIQ